MIANTISIKYDPQNKRTLITLAYQEYSTAARKASMITLLPDQVLIHRVNLLMESLTHHISTALRVSLPTTKPRRRINTVKLRIRSTQRTYLLPYTITPALWNGKSACPSSPEHLEETRVLESLSIASLRLCQNAGVGSVFGSERRYHRPQLEHPP